MALLTISEAALESGYSIELLESLVRKCPKPGQTRLLPHSVTDDIVYIKDSDLEAYIKYLREPWPRPRKGSRPNIPKVIADDVKSACHHACAICGLMDNGEIAHIDPVSETMSNSPDNLILLCPNHHTKYDYGYRPASNITAEEIRAAKLWKRRSRIRIIKYEANAIRALKSLLSQVRMIEADLLKNRDGFQPAILTAELHALLATVPEALKSAYSFAQQDITLPENDREYALQLMEKADLGAVTIAGSVVPTEREMRGRAAAILKVANRVVIDLNEVDCPHCSGHGQYGFRGTFCNYCKGSCYVSVRQADQYDRADIDEVDCPRCAGSGQTGFAGDLCAFCKGDGLVTGDKAESYDEADVDEVNCPHCDGHGQFGLRGTLCKYCRGSRYVSAKKAQEYDRADIDEVNCPRCAGSGQTGFAGDLCAFCKGDGLVTGDKAESYDEADVDEVNCPHCDGHGQYGLRGTLCKYCRGSRYVSAKKAQQYDRGDIDEVDCPRCGGSGQTGFRGDLCAFCNGDRRVTGEMHSAYRERYGDH